MAHPFTLLLQDRRFAALWAGLAFNGFGGQLSGIAIIWLAIESAGAYASFVSTAQLGMTLVVNLAASAFADQFAPRTLMMGANLLSAAVLAFVVTWGSLSGLSLWMLVGAAMVLAALNAVFQPTLLASVPLIAGTRERIQGANALLDATARLSRLLGPFLAGPISALVPVLHFLTINAFTFLLSACGIAAAGKQIASPTTAHSTLSVWSRLTRGLAIASGDRQIGRILAANTVVVAAWFVAVGLGLPFLAAGSDLDSFLFTGIGALAALAGSYGAGDFVSNVLVAGHHPRQPERFMFSGYVLMGLGLVAVPLLMWLLPAGLALPGMMLMCFVAGLGGPMFFIPMMTFFQTDLPQPELGALIRFRFALTSAAMMLGSVLAPLMFGGVGAAWTILAAGGLIAAVGIWGFSALP
jgi:DHA3 family macrolide efflux protein-like MFS transporter